MAETRGSAEEPSRRSDFRSKSFWLEEGEYRVGEALRGERSVDVAIVGGGFTGLSAAYFLKRALPSLEIAVLEKEVVGYGASGRNGGFVMPLLGWNIPDVHRQLGQETTQAAYRFMYEAVDHVDRMVSEHGMACDYERSGYVMLAMNRARLGHLEKEVALAHGMGFDWYRLLDRQGVTEFISSPCFEGGFFDPRCAIFNPARFAREMRRVVTELGVSVYEESPVVAIDPGPRITVRTDQGALTAPKLVLGTNAYSRDLGFFRSRLMPVFTYIVLTEPLTDDQVQAIGWQKRASLETARNLIHYLRLTADNRIALGGEDALYFFGSRHRDRNEKIFRCLRARLVELFPALEGIRFTHAWGGPIGFTLDFFPTVGVSGRSRNIFHSVGYCGHGVSMANYSGSVLSDLVLERRTDRTELFFVNRKPFALPPEPLRWVLAQGYRRALQLQDWWHGRRR